MNIDVEELTQKLVEFGTVYGLQVVAAIAILVVGFLVARVVRKAVRSLLERRQVNRAVVSFTTSLVYVGLLAFVVIAALGRLGVKTTSLVAVIGAAGLAVGLALQGSLSNFAAGFLIMVLQPFKAGDYIEANGVAGVVKHVHIFTTDRKSVV